MTVLSEAPSESRIGTTTVLTFIVPVLLVLYLSGCAPDQPDLRDRSPREIQSVSDRDLCEAYFYGQGPNVREEIERRSLIPVGTWQAVRKNIVRQGMRICSVRAALGAPDETIARTDADVDRRMIYRRKGQRIEVTLVDGRVRRIEQFE